MSKFARRRLAVVMARTGMVENVQTAIKFVEQGHVRVGTDVSFFWFFFLASLRFGFLLFIRPLHLDVFSSVQFFS